jgi:hypothetical protein
MKFEEPQMILVGKAQNVVLGPNSGRGGDDMVDLDSPTALDLGLD